MSKDQALRLALEALESCGEDEWHTEDDFGMGQIYDEEKVLKAITALRQAIAEAQKQERNFCERCGKRLGNGIHTCTPPPKRVVFPTMLRKMWSGGEVQAWLDEHVNKENT